MIHHRLNNENGRKKSLKVNEVYTITIMQYAAHIPGPLQYVLHAVWVLQLLAVISQLGHLYTVYSAFVELMKLAIESKL